MTGIRDRLADDLLAQRLTLSAGAARSQLAAIPWPDGIAPAASRPEGTALPHADVMLVTWTVAEAEALSDVFTPGVDRTAWLPYTKDWASYAKQLTAKSPALEQKCMAHFYGSTVAGQSVLAVKSELHLSTDGVTLPLRQLLAQMLAEVKPSLIITTGTAGGVGKTTELGDVLVTGTAKFNCTKRFKSETFAQSRFTSAASKTSIVSTSTFAKLTRPNAKQLRPVAIRNPRLILTGDVETVDYFAFADDRDSYGVAANDPAARMEEMDDAVLGLVCTQDRPGQAWLSVRNASDPQVATMSTLEAEARWAAAVYAKYGYWTSIGSAVACAQIIAGRASR